MHTKQQRMITWINRFEFVRRSQCIFSHGFDKSNDTYRQRFMLFKDMLHCNKSMNKGTRNCHNRESQGNLLWHCYRNAVCSPSGCPFHLVRLDPYITTTYQAYFYTCVKYIAGKIHLYCLMYSREHDYFSGYRKWRSVSRFNFSSILISFIHAKPLCVYRYLYLLFNVCVFYYIQRDRSFFFSSAASANYHSHRTVYW